MKAGGLVPLDTGGKIRSYYILKELARKHEVAFFTFYSAHPGDVHPELERVFTRVVSLPLAIPAPGSLGDYANYTRHLFSRFPHSMAKFYDPVVSERLRELLRQEAYDVIVSDFLVAAGVVPWDFACPKVLFTHNVEALIWQRHYQVARNPLWKLVCWREYLATDACERRYLKCADRVLAVSEADRKVFAQVIDPAKITVIPTGVDVDYFRPETAAENGQTLVFTGSMDWMPNEDAVFWFVENIMPRIRHDVPEVSLLVVGRRPSERLKALAARAKGLVVTGQVEDIRPFVREASVYVVPIRVGSGTRLKIFEAMAMGKAVVSTAVGAEGLPVQHGRNIILADEPEDFTRQVVTLLKDPEKRKALGLAARQLVETEYSWPAVAARFESVLVGLEEKAPELRKSGSLTGGRHAG